MIDFAARPLGAALFGAALLISCNEADEAVAGAESGAAATTDAAVADGETNWVRTVSKTEEGGYLMGNPDAPVRLIEFASLACPHCASFHETAMTELKGDYIASGEVAYELRTFVMNPADYVATALARCSSPEAFFALSDAFFENQQSWLAAAAGVSQEDAQRLGTMEPQAAMAEFGRLAGLDQFVRARGIPASRYEACVSDEETMAEVEAIRADAIENYNLTGTPTFVVNGEVVDANSWPGVKAALDEAI
jgi:protein-disulfide isomerase